MIEIKHSKIRRQTVSARPSKIRRAPPAVPQRPVSAYPSEREILIVAIGVILFAMAIAALIVGISDITSA